MNGINNRLVALGASAVLFGSGCLGSGDLGTGSGPNGNGPNGNNPGATGAPPAEFAAAAPAVAKCGGGGCHEGGASPKFLGNTGTGDDYASLKSNAGAVMGNPPKILTYGQNGAHSGRTRYTMPEALAVQAWLGAEAKGTGNNGNGGTQQPPPQGGGTVSAGLAGFAQCMTEADFTAANMADWANKNSNEGPCVNCHPTAAQGTKAFAVNGFVGEQNDALFLATLKAQPWTYFNHNAITNTVEISRAKLVRFGTSNNHPNFNTNANDTHFGYLQTFYQATLTRQQAGNCAPTGYEAQVGEFIPPDSDYVDDIGGMACRAGGSNGGLFTFLLLGVVLALSQRRRRMVTR